MAQDSCRLQVYEKPAKNLKANTPHLLFIHGWSQSHWVWKKQWMDARFKDWRLVFYDLRGHGQSDKPRRLKDYWSEPIWASDLNAIIEQLRLRPVSLIAWSYGALVALDWWRFYGSQDNNHLQQLHFVAPTLELNNASIHQRVGNKMHQIAKGMTSTDTRLQHQAETLMLDCLYRPNQANPDDMLLRQQLKQHLNACPIWVRKAMLKRNTSNAALLGTINVAVSSHHGVNDPLMLLSMSQLLLELCPNSQLYEYPSAHAPFLQCPELFNQRLYDSL